SRALRLVGLMSHLAEAENPESEANAAQQGFGAVSMDLILLDLTESGGEDGEVVTLLGADGVEEVTADELALRSGTLVYEVLCHFGLRLPRHALGTAAPARRERAGGAVP
ncbi:MAG: hypothetical protein F9K18_09300, partial [Thermoanaerobaculia bacterium]